MLDGLFVQRVKWKTPKSHFVSLNVRKVPGTKNRVAYIQAEDVGNKLSKESYSQKERTVARRIIFSRHNDAEDKAIERNQKLVTSLYDFGRGRRIFSFTPRHFPIPPKLDFSDMHS